MPNFYSRFLQSVDRWPDAVALEVQRRDCLERHTYMDVRHMADGVARWLGENGVPRGARCAILAANGPRWVAAFLGVVAVGAVAVPLDTAFTPSQVATVLRASGTTLLFTDPKYLADARRAIEGMPVRIVLLEKAESSAECNLETVFAAGGDDFAPTAVGDDELAAISYTSGTTCDPKGVMLTHGNLRAETEAVFDVIHLGPGDAIMGILPLFHVLALETNVLLPLAAGARVLFLETLNTTELVRALPSVNIFVCVPQFFYLIHERIWKEVEERGALARAAFRAMLALSRAGQRAGLNLGKVFFREVHRLIGPKRYLVTGGSRFDPQIGRDFEAMGFTMLQAYGLTETCGAATYTPPGAVNIASVGQPLPRTEVRIVNPRVADDGGPSIGEVAIRGPIVMKGYYERPDATAEALRDGWLYTGDLGYLDATGDLMLTGRDKDVIVLSSGKNVYPEEIEEHYLKHPFIKEICVLGLESPDQPSAERLHAVIVPKFDVLREKKIVNTGEALRFQLESLSAQLPPTKRILSYEISAEDLPRTTTRKLKRFEIERRVRNRSLASPGSTQGVEPVRELAEEDQRWLLLPDVQRAIKVIREPSKTQREIRPNDNLESRPGTGFHATSGTAGRAGARARSGGRGIGDGGGLHRPRTGRGGEGCCAECGSTADSLAGPVCLGGDPARRIADGRDSGRHAPAPAAGGFRLPRLPDSEPVPARLAGSAVHRGGELAQERAGDALPQPSELHRSDRGADPTGLGVVPRYVLRGDYRDFRPGAGAQAGPMGEDRAGRSGCEPGLGNEGSGVRP